MSNNTHSMSIGKITSEMTLYGPILLLIIGTIGCACNLLTFTSKKLRRNSCAFYFLCSSIFDFLSIIFGLLTRLAADHFGSRLQNTSQSYCKFRAYAVSAIPLIATYFVLLSAIDRCMSSSRHVRLRSFSQMVVAYRAAVIVILLGMITCSHILVSYNLRPKCATLPGSYAIFDGMFVVFWLGVIPHVLMWIFGSITLINIRRLEHRRMGERTDRQLIIVSSKRQPFHEENHLRFVDDVSSSWFKFILDSNSNDLLCILSARRNINWWEEAYRRISHVVHHVVVLRQLCQIILHLYFIQPIISIDFLGKTSRIERWDSSRKNSRLLFLNSLSRRVFFFFSLFQWRSLSDSMIDRSTLIWLITHMMNENEVTITLMNTLNKINTLSSIE